MVDKLSLHKEDLLTNPSCRLAIALCLDVSGSMSGDPIGQLNVGLKLFFDALQTHPDTRDSAEVSIVSFAESSNVELDFSSLQRIASTPSVNIPADSGATDLGGGVQLAVALLNARQKEYERVGVDYFAPFLVIMSDGCPTTKSHGEASAVVRSLEADGDLIVLPIGIGAGADLDLLKAFSDKRQPVRLKGLSFAEFFDSFSKCVIRVSQSRPGEKVKMFTEDEIRGWGEL